MFTNSHGAHHFLVFQFIIIEGMTVLPLVQGVMVQMLATLIQKPNQRKVWLLVLESESKTTTEMHKPANNRVLD